MSLKGMIRRMQRGSPKRQAEAERRMRAASSKQQQLYGTTGRADVAAARQAKLGSEIRTRQGLIGEESRRASIGLEMRRQQLESQLKTARVNRQYMRAQRDRMKGGVTKKRVKGFGYPGARTSTNRLLSLGRIGGTATKRVKRKKKVVPKRASGSKYNYGVKMPSWLRKGVNLLDF